MFLPRDRQVGLNAATGIKHGDERSGAGGSNLRVAGASAMLRL